MHYYLYFTAKELEVGSKRLKHLPIACKRENTDLTPGLSQSKPLLFLPPHSASLCNHRLTKKKKKASLQC